MYYVILVGLVIGLAVWLFYLGRKLSALQKDLGAAQDYIKRQYGVLGAFLNALKRKEDLDEFLKTVRDVDDPTELHELYQKLVSKASGSGHP